MTPHISAKLEDVAKVVLMPGDPLRAKWIAENYLKDAKLINEVRGMLGYTGTYKGQKVTVMAHGMGMPSIGIYTHELYHFYNVDTIIRIGSAGSFIPEADVGNVIIVEDAYSNSAYANDIGVKAPQKYLSATPEIINLCEATAKQLQIKTIHGNILSEDAFYHTLG
jgi:purine-nucleoside phosphorylase